MRIRHENRVKVLSIALFIVISSPHLGCSQGIKTANPSAKPLVINNVATYKKSILADTSQRLVLLQSIIPQIVIDLKYATNNNFTHKILYKSADAYARLPTAFLLKKINTYLKEKGLGLKVFDAYRPYSATKKMWKLIHDDRYTADPKTGSGHNRGAAVDLTLIKLSTGKELDMPTPFDDFTEKAHHDYMDLPAEAIAHRKLLRETMEKFGFVTLKTEWWHYSLPNASSRFALLDLTFAQLHELQKRN